MEKTITLYEQEIKDLLDGNEVFCKGSIKGIPGVLTLKFEEVA